MRIIHVIPSMATRTGGPAFSTASCALACQRLGHDVTILTTTQGAPAQRADANAILERCDLPPAAADLNVQAFPVRRLHRWSYSPALAERLSQIAKSADIVHIHSLNLYPQFAAFRAALKAYVPYVVSPRGALDPYLRSSGKWRKAIMNLWWQRRMLDDAAALHLTSADEARAVADLKLLALHVVVPNILDLETFRTQGEPSNFRRKYLDGFTGPLVLNHGRLSRKKGLDHLVASMAIVRESIQDARLALIGPDDEDIGANLRNLAMELGIAGAVTFVGPLQGQSLAEAVVDCDVWALPSYAENFGMAVGEAMAAGKPVVTSPYVNIAPEAAAFGALIMVENDPDLIANEIINLLDSPDRHIQLGQRGREYMERYDWRLLGPQYIAMYNDAIEYHQRRGPFKRRFQ
jgi:glycosyltransferase involved in cell wall biosynthesis